ncbi:DNA-dependent ATPase fun30 [Umbelopsis sp. WA50703]
MASFPNSPSNVSVSSDSSLQAFSQDFEKVQVKSNVSTRVQWESSDDDVNQPISSTATIPQLANSSSQNDQSPLPQRTRVLSRLKRKKRPAISLESDSEESDTTSIDGNFDLSAVEDTTSGSHIKRLRKHSLNDENIMPEKHTESELEYKISRLQKSFQSRRRSSIEQALINANGMQVKAASELILSEKTKQQISIVKPSSEVSSNSNIAPQRKSAIIINDESEEEEEMNSEDETDSEVSDTDYAIDEEVVKLDQQAVDFFNNSSCQDIQDVTACNAQQADDLSNLRPFNDIEDLQVKLRSTKGLGERFITSYKDMMQGYSAVDKLVSDIEGIGAELDSIVSGWKKTNTSSEDTTDDISINATLEGYIDEQPKIMSKQIALKSYQIFGINWMLLLYRRKLSGILADEMGLGKTAQVIGFLAELISEGRNGPHLIVVPSSTLENWLREFQKFCPSLDVRSYYGSQKERVELRYDLREDRDWPILVTTYQMATGSGLDRKFLRNINFDVTILDEGHMVKNCTSARYQHLMSIPSSFRLLLTGTPLQNNLQELVSLLTFILPNMFAENNEGLQKIFKIKYTSNTMKGNNKNRDNNSDTPSGSSSVAQMLSMERIKRAKKMMTPFVLRRQKSQVHNDLPEKIHVVKRCLMTARQSQIYQSVVQNSKKSLHEDVQSNSSDTGSKELTSLNTSSAKMPPNHQYNAVNILMELRKAANHPLLLRRIYNDELLRTMAKEIKREEQFWDSEEQYIYEDMTVMTDFQLNKLCLAHRTIKQHALDKEMVMDAGKVQVFKKLLLDLKQKGQRVLVFSQFTMMLDVLEEVLDNMQFRYSRLDGSSKVDTRQGLIDEFSENTDITVFLLSTKAGGFGINLTAANVVILYDLDPNPHNDKQAEDRAHRVGQTKEVTVVRLISEDTVEENIYKMANVKLRLDQSVSFDQDDESDSESGEKEENIKSLVQSALHL